MGNYTLTNPTRSHIRKLLFTQYNEQENSEQENLLHRTQCTVEFQKNEKKLIFMQQTRHLLIV